MVEIWTQAKNRVPKNWKLKFRHATSFLRKDPDYIILGAQKAGTSFLWSALASHPEVQNSTKKEVHYFDNRYNKNIAYYRSHFPWKYNNEFITGEASPCYLFYPQVAKRIFFHYPKIKLIVLLRDPVERAYSQYKMQKDWNLLSPDTTFEKCLEKEICCVHKLEGVQLENSRPIPHENCHALYSYVRRGMYAKQIEQYLKYFDRSQFLFIQSENMFNNHVEKVNEVLDFLHLDPIKNLNEEEKFGFYSKKHNPMKTESRLYLQNYFSPLNRKLYKLLGHDFGWNTGNDRDLGLE